MRYMPMRESISLAFITAVQRLPPRQRAVLILRDVLGFAASEAAQILGCTEESVTSALKRARASMHHGLPQPAEPPTAPESASEKQLTRAYETGDVDGIIALFAEDAWLTMPPAPLEYRVDGRHGPGRHDEPWLAIVLAALVLIRKFAPPAMWRLDVALAALVAVLGIVYAAP